MFIMTNAILTLNQRQDRCPDVGLGSTLILPCVGGSAGGESSQSLVELLFLSSFQMMKQSATRRTTVFQVMSASTAAVRSLLPGLLSLSVGSQSSMLCLPSCEGSSVSLQSPCSHSLTAKRTEREAQIFLLGEAQIFLLGKADGLRLCWVDAG